MHWSTYWKPMAFVLPLPCGLGEPTSMLGDSGSFLLKISRISEISTAVFQKLFPIIQIGFKVLMQVMWKWSRLATRQYRHCVGCSVWKGKVTFQYKAIC
ncbi:hypothetical protein AE618_12020 [Bosea vaviloviae]|uniref:Uncharacterized protein n=1 Tax=Bosea vaviloviae TaxID=1526658 RepID=A0A0N1F4N4_9HYPH|nr:hypothetical protein AE618_12020 [Bosea vaviloviae]